MKKSFLTLTFALLSIGLFAQNSIVTQLKTAYDAKKYDQMISTHASKTASYPAKAIYYIGLAYYHKSDDKSCLNMMNLALQKEQNDPEIYFIKGATLSYLKKPQEAIQAIKQAIALDATQCRYFSALGDAFLEQNKFKEALQAYITATQKENIIERPFAMIPQLYAELEQPQKALKAFYKAKEVISKESDFYALTLYNIGLYEYINQHYDKSKNAFTELLTRFPNDFQSHSKLIQVYFAQKEYEKAKPHRKILYKAYEEGKLKGRLKERFCFDQFKWKNKKVFVYENFAEKKGKLYYKHVFYVVNPKGNTELTIQTENSPISQELGGPKYAIGMTRESSHSTFGFIKENFDYNKLKATIIQILNDEVVPSASSTMKTKDK